MSVRGPLRPFVPLLLSLLPSRLRVEPGPEPEFGSEVRVGQAPPESRFTPSGVGGGFTNLFRSQRAPPSAPPSRLRSTTPLLPADTKVAQLNEYPAKNRPIAAAPRLSPKPSDTKSLALP